MDDRNNRRLNLNEGETMKLKILILLAAIMIACVGRAVAQTNDNTDAAVPTSNESKTGLATNRINHVQDIRVVNGQPYDVTTSKKWVSITIPAGSVLNNASGIHFTGQIQPKKVFLVFPHSKMAAQWPTVMIQNFPYNPIYFAQNSENQVVTRDLLNLRVFPLSHPSTNWTALGEMKITPARPDFDYGLPYTNKVSNTQKTDVQP
jgi:hypothetical protein